MKLRGLFILNAVLAFGFGVGYVLIPGTMLDLYGMEPTSSANLAGQLFGVELIAVGLLCWFVRDIADSAALQAIILALLIAHVVGLIVVLTGTLSGVMNAFGWSGVVIYLVFAAGYAYFRLVKPSSSWVTIPAQRS